MDTVELFTRAKAVLGRRKRYVSTDELVGCSMLTPLGIARISAVSLSHTRRVEGRSISYYRIALEDIPIRSIVTAKEQWMVI